MEPQALKSALLRVRENGMEPPDAKARHSLSWEMLRHIGSTDSELRDGLIYEILFGWIMGGHIPNGELCDMLAACLDESHLFYRLGEGEADGVFTRAFSLLILVPLIGRHEEAPYLSPEQIEATGAALLDYIPREKDLRGFVPVKGWAHAIAHAADGAGELMECPELEKQTATALAYALTDRVATGEAPLFYGERERVCAALRVLWRRGRWSGEEWLAYAQGLASRMQTRGDGQQCRIAYGARDFLNALYFALRAEENSQTVTSALERALTPAR